MVMHPDPAFYSLSKTQREKKKLAPKGHRLCRRCQNPISDEASHRQHAFMHRDCFLASMKELNVKYGEGHTKTPEIDVSKLKSPFDILKMIRKFK